MDGRFWRSVDRGPWVRVTAEVWRKAEARRNPNAMGAVFAHLPARLLGESVQEWRSRCRFMAVAVDSE